MEKYLDKNSVLRLLQGIKTQIEKSKTSVLDTKGVANGIASLDENGNVPLSQLGNVDTVLFEIVYVLPTELTEQQKNHIFIVPRGMESESEKNTYKEYIYTGEDLGHIDPSYWEELGEFTSEVDLKPYSKKSETTSPSSFKFKRINEGGELALLYTDATGKEFQVKVPRANSGNENDGLMTAPDKLKLDRIDLNALTESINAANTAAANTNKAIQAAETATAGAEKVDATITEENVFEVTDRTGTKKSLDMSGLVSAQDTIKELQDTKVDKEEGKSLIEDEVKECFRVISNEEFLWAVVDSEDRVLFGFYRATGKPYYPLNEMYHVEQNEEFFAVWLDAANHVLFGIRRDGEIIGEIHAVNVLKETIKKIQKDIQDDISSLRDEVGVIDSNLKELLDVFSLQENPEYLAVEKDADGRILSTTNADGSHYIHNVKSESIITKIKEIEDVENRKELILDENNRILGYRDESGKRYENSMDIKELSLDGTKVDLSQFPTKEDVEDLELKNINGVYDNNKPNLYLTSQKTFTTADGKQSFTPPNEGAEMSNRISCKAGDWFTRTGTATGMVVVTDENDNNAVRLMPEGKLPGATVQIPESWNWAAYIRFAVATYESNVVINKGKYAVSKANDSVSIPKLKLNVANFTKETKYLQSPNGTFYELSVSDTGELSVNVVDKDLIDSFDIPSDLKYTISNPSGGTPVFCGTAKRVLLHNEKYLFEVKENGLTKYLSIADSSSYFYNVEHQVNSKGEFRIVALLRVAPYIGLCVFDENFTLIDKLSGSYDTHDFIYIDDFHYIVYRNSNIFNIDGHSAYSNKIEEWKDGRKIAEYTLNDVDVLKDIMFDAKVHGTAPIAETHTNTIGFDRTQDRIILNPRNCCSWIILKRTVSDNGNVTFGPVLEQVGGLHASKNYEAVSRRIKTTDLAQWFLCHDVKYWGMKSVNGKEYPTYTLFDNNYLMDENPRNNSSSNSSSNTNSASTCSRVVQLSIDWENRTIVDYKVYAVPKYYSNVMSSAWMMDEGKFCIDYAMMGTIIFADFTTSDTTISEDGHLYTGAKITWKLKQQKLLYRANIY